MKTNGSNRLVAQSISPAARKWLTETEKAYILQSFRSVINCVNQEGNVLSATGRLIGNGPFSVVIEDEIFPETVSGDSLIEITEEGIWIDDLFIDASAAETWEAHPNWSEIQETHASLNTSVNALIPLLLRHALADSFARLVIEPDAEIPLPARVLAMAKQNIPKLFDGIKNKDVFLITQASQKLAGLGPGLTPAGDDLLLGVIYGMWTLFSEEESSELAGLIAENASPRTHALSAAWLKAGANGEAAETWHALFDALVKGDAGKFEQAVLRILPSGHTSGADALGGFAGVIQQVTS
ncbi:MAG: DUF2877 domain-containing protein [Anaerolineales bacterium]